MEQSILEAIDYVRNVSKKTLSFANILSRISKTSASTLDTRSLEKELHRMIAKGLIGNNHKIVNHINLKLNVETTSKDTLSNKNVEQVSSLKQSSFTDTPSDIHLSTEDEPITPEQLDTSSSMDDNISVCDFKNQIMRLNSEIEALKSFFLEQIFVVKNSLKEKHLLIGDCDLVVSLQWKVKYLTAENQMKTAIIKTISEKENSLAQCSHSVIAPILESPKGNLKSNSPSKSTRSEFLNNVVEVSKENTCDKSPTIHSDKNRQKNLQMLLYQLEVPIVIRNASKNTNTKDITKRIDNKRKVYVRQFSGSKVDCMKERLHETLYQREQSRSSDISCRDKRRSIK